MTPAVVNDRPVELPDDFPEPDVPDGPYEPNEPSQPDLSPGDLPGPIPLRV